MADEKGVQVFSITKQEMAEMMASQCASIEAAIARLARDTASSYGEIIQDRHTIDKLRERIERIERRLELS